MRNQGRKKAGFYPTPVEVVELVASFVERPLSGENHRFLDPCCGEGEALRILAERLGVRETYGIELDSERAKQASKVLKQVLASSFESMRSVFNGFSLLFLNPPYDFDEETKRLEHQFLVRMTPYLAPGGLLVFIITKKNLIKETARFLATHYENIQAYRFPAPFFEEFHQIVLFGTRRTPASRDVEAEKALLKFANLETTETPVLQECAEPVYFLPEPASHFAFFSDDLKPDMALVEIQSNGLLSEGRVRDLLFPDELPAVKPLMPLRRGHLAMLISAGYLNNTLLKYKGERLLIKGRCVKEQVKSEVEEEDRVTVIERDVIKTTIKGLSLDTGKLITIE